MLLLILGVITFLAGPVVYNAISQSERLKAGLDLAIGVVMIYLLSRHIFPEIYESSGTLGLLISAIGFAFISLFEYLCRHRISSAYKAILVIVFIGFAAHVALDGLALYTSQAGLSTEHAHAHDHSAETLSAIIFVILLHRLPVALLVWSTLTEVLSPIKSYSILVLMSFISVMGYSMGATLMNHPTFLAKLSYFDAFIAGCLAHVIVHQLNHARVFLLNVFNHKSHITNANLEKKEGHPL